MRDLVDSVDSKWELLSSCLSSIHHFLHTFHVPLKLNPARINPLLIDRFLLTISSSIHIENLDSFLKYAYADECREHLQQHITNFQQNDFELPQDVLDQGDMILNALLRYLAPKKLAEVDRKLWNDCLKQDMIKRMTIWEDNFNLYGVQTINSSNSYASPSNSSSSSSSDPAPVEAPDQIKKKKDKKKRLNVFDWRTVTKNTEGYLFKNISFYVKIVVLTILCDMNVDESNPIRDFIKSIEKEKPENQKDIPLERHRVRLTPFEFDAHNLYYHLNSESRGTSCRLVSVDVESANVKVLSSTYEEMVDLAKRLKEQKPKVLRASKYISGILLPELDSALTAESKRRKREDSKAEQKLLALAYVRDRSSRRTRANINYNLEALEEANLRHNDPYYPYSKNNTGKAEVEEEEEEGRGSSFRGDYEDGISDDNSEYKLEGEEEKMNRDKEKKRVNDHRMRSVKVGRVLGDDDESPSSSPSSSQSSSPSSSPSPSVLQKKKGEILYGRVGRKTKGKNEMVLIAGSDVHDDDDKESSVLASASEIEDDRNDEKKQKKKRFRRAAWNEEDEDENDPIWTTP